MKINAVSACWSSLPYEMAIQNIADGTVEPILGQLYSEHVQLCPQHPDHISEELIERLMDKFTQIQFRLHSDVRLVNKRGITIDLIDFNSDTQWYFETLAKYSKQMNAPLYSLHAGTRRDYSIEDLFYKAQKLQEIFECPVAIEGHYPFSNNKYLINSWSEYEALYRSGLNYALDLSHLNIVAQREGWQDDLTVEMLSSKQCREIHISFNEGHLDNHMIATENQTPLWEKWKEMIIKSQSTADIFSEGNQVLHLRKQKKNEANSEKEVTYMN